MRTIFDVLFVVRKFHNYVQNMLVNLTGAKVLNNEQNNFNNYFEEKGEQIKGELLELKDEFKLKVIEFQFLKQQLKIEMKKFKD